MNIFVIQSLWERWIYSRTRYEKVTNYIWGHLISWSPNQSHFECHYNYATKLQLVCKWEQKNGFAACAKKEEAICDDKLVNFFKEKDHKNCICSKV